MKGIARAAGPQYTPGWRYRELMARLGSAAQRRDLPQTERLGGEAVRVASEQGWHGLAVAAYWVVGGALLAASKPQQAAVRYQQAEVAAAKAEAQGEPQAAELRLKTRLALGAAQVTGQEWAPAAVVYEQSVPLAQKLKDTYLELECWRMGSFCRECLQEWDKAWENGQRAWEAGKRLTPEARTTATLPYVAEALVRLGRARHIVTDHLGTPVEMYDDLGKLAWRMQLDVFGVGRNDMARQSCPWRWPGQYEDPWGWRVTWRIELMVVLPLVERSPKNRRSLGYAADSTYMLIRRARPRVSPNVHSEESPCTMVLINRNTTHITTPISMQMPRMSSTVGQRPRSEPVMSLFLVYFEIGKPVPHSSPLPRPLVQMPMVVVSNDRAGPARPAIAITDGVASDHFQRYGNKVAARRGAELRQSLFEFIKQRLAQGARPHLVFLVIQGVLKEAKVDLDSKEQVVLDDLEGAFAHIEPGHIIEVVSRQSGA